MSELRHSDLGPLRIRSCNVRTGVAAGVARNAPLKTGMAPNEAPENEAGVDASQRRSDSGREEACFPPCLHSLCAGRGNRERRQSAILSCAGAGKIRYPPSREKNPRPATRHLLWPCARQAYWCHSECETNRRREALCLGGCTRSTD